MDTTRLQETITRMLRPRRLILAADESTKTAGKRLAKVGLENTEENRLQYRTTLLDAEGLEQYISAVILVDETTRQKGEDRLTFVESLTGRGIVPGIKVDEGLADVPHFRGEQLAKGLDKLAERLQKYIEESRGELRFTKWRQTVNPAYASDYIITHGMARMAEFAALSQEHGFIPIVEPEILMDGDPGTHTGEQCRDVTKRTLEVLFQELKKAGVHIDLVILKTNMVLPGGKCPGGKWETSRVGKETYTLLESVLPRELPGVVFLSGGMGTVESTANLSAVATARNDARGTRYYSGSYGRALQDRSLRTWAGKAENVTAARKKLLEDAEQNSLAQEGKWEEAGDPRERD